MILNHTTHRWAFNGIQVSGLLTVCSMTSLRVVYLHDDTMIEWARRHVATHHFCSLRDVVRFVVELPDDLVKKLYKGVYRTWYDIPPEQFREVFFFSSGQEQRLFWGAANERANLIALAKENGQR